jgi:hypothetical protein
MNKCVDCIHFTIESEGWEYRQFDYADCKRRPNMMSLKSFPFKNTKCMTYEAKETNK